jgi:phospholipid/cholesterol/gamma-HCH transport system permease protein
MRGALENAGRSVQAGISEIGLGAVLLAESLTWLAAGPVRGQPVRLSAVVAQAHEIGVRALPIVTLLSLAIGAMVAIQGIYTLRLFGAESKVTIGVAISLTRGRARRLLHGWAQ